MRLAEKDLSRHGLARVGIIGVRLVLVATIGEGLPPRAERVGDTIDRTEVGAIGDLDIA